MIQSDEEKKNHKGETRIYIKNCLSPEQRLTIFTLETKDTGSKNSRTNIVLFKTVYALSCTNAINFCIPEQYSVAYSWKCVLIS